MVTALSQSEHVKNVVEECAVELSDVNTVLQKGTLDHLPLAEIEKALEQSIIIENKVTECVEELAIVNGVLADEIDERMRIEHALTISKEQEEKARHQAFHDPLTGLPNRILFKDRLDHGLAQAKRHGWCLAVMFVDLDEFKAINDTHGHDVGDLVLKTMSQRLRATIRDEDTVSRQGGDEFLYLLLEISEPVHIENVVKKILLSIQQPCNANGLNLTVHASIGIATFPHDADGAEELIKCADEAMYRAKRNKSGYAFFSTHPA